MNGARSQELSILREVHARTIDRRNVVAHSTGSLAQATGIPLERVVALCRHLAQMNRVRLYTAVNRHAGRKGIWFTSAVSVLAGERLRERLAELEEREHIDVQREA